MPPNANRPGRGGPGRLLERDVACAGGGSVSGDRTRGPRQLDRLNRYLETAHLTDLGRLLDEVGIAPPDPSAFFCIRCQRTPAEQIAHAPAAYAVSPMAWHCTACRATGTRWNIVNVLRSRATARARLLAHLDGGDAER